MAQKGFASRVYLLRQFGKIGPIMMCGARLLAVAVLLCGASALRPTTRIGGAAANTQQLSRRNALALLPLVVAPQLAHGRVKEGAAADYLAKAKARQEAATAAADEAAAAPQPGRVSFKQSSSNTGIPATFAEMVQKSKDQREAAMGGMSMSDEEVKELEAKVRKAFPGVK